MRKHFERPPSSTWPSDQPVPEIIGDSDDVLAMSDDAAYVLLSRLFGPSIPRTVLVQDIDMDVGTVAVDLTLDAVTAVDVTVEMEG